MSIAIFLRKQLAVNWFRDIVVNSVSASPDCSVLLCSGFFQERQKKSCWCASQEQNFAGKLSASRAQLTTVGIHNGSWKESYRHFRDSLVNAGVAVTAKYVNGLKWHAKIFILSIGGRPQLGVIGSSNLTRPAFGAIKDFNYECDVAIWPDASTVTNGVIERVLGGDGYDPHEVILAPYDPRLNRGLTVEDRLKQLEREVLAIEAQDLR